MNAVIHHRPERLPLQPACIALSVARSTIYARRSARYGPPNRSRARAKQPRAYSESDRQVIVETLTCERFVNQPPAQVYHQLLDEGRYLASISTMHRVLRQRQLQGDRRAQRPTQRHAVPH
ncbi:hypothetical protein OAS86_00445 [Gammaproteobacteria bacterium]|nr:hypothetical protein [Gammaproteobacteria bacterium]